MGNRKFVLAVKTWGGDEAIHAWKFLKSHILQAKDAGMWNDELVVVHVAKGKREKEPWDQGGAMIASLETALQPYKHDVFDLEGDPGQLLVDIANKEQADILVLATRGRNAMKKAMMGSMTEFVMLRANCACLVIKPQIGAGDTYRMKSAAQPQGAGAAAALQSQMHVLQSPRAQSPGSSPMYRMASLPCSTPFNRRVCVAYDTTASGRFLLKWAVDTILEPTDNVFVVRAVPNLKMRKPGTSFGDKNYVQRLARDALPGFSHITTFNLQQGNARKSVLGFVAKESVDLLIIGIYKPNTRRKGLGLRGNAIILSNRCACPCLVVPMSETALQSCVKATDLELAAAEEEELASGSEEDSDDDEQAVGVPVAAAGRGISPSRLGTGGGAADPREDEQEHGAAHSGVHEAGQAGSPDLGGSLSASLKGSSAAAIKQIRAPLEALFKDFKRRGSTGPTTPSSSETGESRRTALLAALQHGSSSLQAGRYVLEVDSHGAVKHIKHGNEKHGTSTLGPSAAATPAVTGGPAAGGTAELLPLIGAQGAVATSELDVLPSLEDGLAGAAVSVAPSSVVAAAAAAAIPPPAAVAAAATEPGDQGSCSVQEDVKQLQRLLAAREAEVTALQQRLDQLKGCRGLTSDDQAGTGL